MGDTGAMRHMQSLIDDTTCVETVRALRWSDGVRCPAGESAEVTNQGRDDTQPERQRSLCKPCSRRFDDVTDTLVAGHQQPLRVWMGCLYLMGLHRSNAHMAKALDLHPSDVQQMTCQLRQGMVAKKPSPTLSNAVECDEVYSVAGHQGKPDAGAQKGVAVGAAGSGAHADGAPSKPRNRRSSA
jgi:transposase-like protein